MKKLLGTVSVFLLLLVGCSELNSELGSPIDSDETVIGNTQDNLVFRSISTRVFEELRTKGHTSASSNLEAQALTDLLTNGGFESGLTGWEACNAGDLSISSNAYAGSRAGNLNQAGGCFYQTVDVSAGQDLTLTCYARLTNSSGWSGLGLGFSDSNFQLVADAPERQIVSSSYTRYSTSLVAPSNSANAAVWVYTDGSVLVDSCEIILDTGGNGGTNLLNNASFESGQANWSPCSGSGYSINSDAALGNRALQLSAGGCFYQQIEATAGQDYSLSCQAKRNSSAWTTMTMTFSDSNYQNLASALEPITSTGYQTYSVNQTAPTATRYGVITLYSESVAQFDDCVFSAGSEPPPPPPPPPSDNLLINGGFESGQTGWVACSTQGLNVDNDSSAGARALRVTNGGCIYQQVSVSAGETLTLSCDAKRSNANWTTMTLTYSNSSFTSLAREEKPISSSSYQAATITKTAPSGTRYGVVTLYSESIAHFDACVLNGGADPPPPPPPPGNSDAHIIGQWDAPVNWPIVAVHSTLLPNGKILSWPSGDNVSFPEQAPSDPIHNQTPADVYTIATGQHSQLMNNTTELICSGHTQLPNGELFIAAGNLGTMNGAGQYWIGQDDLNIYNPSTNSFRRGQDMAFGRWYPTALAMPNGEVLVAGGLNGDGVDSRYIQADKMEIWNNGSWRTLSGSTYDYRLLDYPKLFLAPNGKVFITGDRNDSRNLFYFDTTGNGSLSFEGIRGSNHIESPAVMYTPGKILLAGGTSRTTNIVDITIGDIAPTVTQTNSMILQRRNHNATILADGTIFVNGGSSNGEYDGTSRYAAELWSPTTGNWKAMDKASVARNYHSTSLLLPDGRVWTAGGGNCGGCPNNYNAEFYNPPYLYKSDGSGQLAARPTITSVSDSVAYFSTFNVGISSANSIDKVSLIRLGSTTHAFNVDQRYVPLNFTSSGSNLSVKAPIDWNIAPPGYYMLFAVDNNGVPSIAKIIKLVAN